MVAVDELLTTRTNTSTLNGKSALLRARKTSTLMRKRPVWNAQARQCRLRTLDQLLAADHGDRRRIELARTVAAGRDFDAGQRGVGQRGERAGQQGNSQNTHRCNLRAKQGRRAGGPKR